MATNTANLAVLIDADNVSHNVIVGLLAEIANYGTASVKRIYGDWTNPTMNGWKPKLLQHSLIPIQQFAYTTGKNATDGAMIIDAMDLLYTGRFSAFCIVSSDSDFTRLASRIREQGLTVHGFGERKTPNAFVAACDKFMYFDVLNISPQEDVATVPITSSESKSISNSAHSGNQVSGKPEILNRITPTNNTRPLDQAALVGLKLAITNAPIYSGDWVNLAEVGLYLSKFSPDVHPRNYGYQRLREFIEASRLVDLEYRDIGENRPPVALARLKDDRHKARSQQDSGAGARKGSEDDGAENGKARQGRSPFVREQTA